MSGEQAMDRRIGKRIRQRRLELGVTLRQLAETLGCTYQQVQKFENGANRIAAVQLHRLAVRLEVPIDWFFDEDADTPAAAATLGRHAGNERATLDLSRSMAVIDDPGVRNALAALARAIAGRNGSGDGGTG